MESENVIIPEDWIRGKAIQVDVNGIPFLKLGTDRHASLLEIFLVEREIDHEYTKWGGPELKGDKYIVIGMGLWEKKDNVITLGGKSADYQIGINEERLKEMREYRPDLEFKFDEFLY